MKRSLLFALFAILLLLVFEILRVYFIMPFPGSQRANTIEQAYFINKYLWSIRILGFMMLVPFAWRILNKKVLWKKMLLVFFLMLYGAVFYLVNFRFLAEKMFLQPVNKKLVQVAENKVDTSKLVIGITINGQARAYPIEIIGYHHMVTDTVGGQPVLVTYCSVCRTGRVYSPLVNGILQHFRLVGMDHFNAFFEDEDTKSWWRQATGVAAVGKLKGAALNELFSRQSRLGAWIKEYPNTLILQPDSLFARRYKELEGFDEGTIKSGLEKRDSSSWKFKSWVLGVSVDGQARAYDWNALVNRRVIYDTIQNIPIVIELEKDGVSFHVWKNQGNNLIPVPAYQEFWHSWQYFHPGTSVYKRN